MYYKDVIKDYNKNIMYKMFFTYINIYDNTNKYDITYIL